MKHFLTFLPFALLSTLLLATSPLHAVSVKRLSRIPKVRSFPITRKSPREGYKLSLDKAHTRTPLARSVFRAHPKDYDSSFSGTIFKGRHKGEEGTFAAIATHTLHIINDNGIIDEKVPHSLGRYISAEIFDEEGRSIPIELEVVKVGATPMADLSLLKVLPEYEDQVNALGLNLQDISEDTLFSVQGFTQKPFPFMNRLEDLHIARTSPLSLRALIPGLRFQINGMCGGAVVDEEGNLIGIFIGYTNYSEEPEPKIGYIAPAKFLQTLIDAYYEEPDGTFPVELHGQKIIDLEPEEFVSFITLRDANHDILKYEYGSSKFSHRKINELLDSYPDTRYIELEIGKVEWAQNNPEYLDVFTGYRIIEYDFLQQRLVRDIVLSK